MGKRTLKSMKALEREMQRRVNKALKDEVGPYVKERLLSHIKTDVLDTYHPIVETDKTYERRPDGLGNPENIKIIAGENKIIVRDQTDIEGPRLSENNQKTVTDFAKLIEKGAHNPWDNDDYVWMHPRPFVTNTKKELKKNPKVIMDIIKKSM